MASVLLGTILLLVAANSCSTLHSPTVESPLAPSYLADRLRADVRHLSETIGERNAWHPEALDSSADWIEQRFQSLGYETRRQAVSTPGSAGVGDQTFWNIEAIRPGADRANEVIVVGAHYDSKVATSSWKGQTLEPLRLGTPGANDNASGIAGLLAIAEYLAQRPVSRTVRIVAWVNEEPPFMKTAAMGSVVHAGTLAEDPRIEVIGAICLDVIGCYSPQVRTKRIRLASRVGLPDRPDYVAFLSNRSSRRFAREVADTFSRFARIHVRTVSFPAVSDAVAWSDDWSYWQVGIPAFCVTDTAWLRSDRYHEVSDTWDALDYPIFADVVWAMAQTIGFVANPGG